MNQEVKKTVTFKSIKKQAGITLMEVISGLLVIGLVIAGALSLFGTADSSQKSNQMLSDITAIRASIKGLYAGQGGYGTANLNGVLKTSNRIPSTMTADNATPPVITHALNGTTTVTGITGGTAFTIALTNIPTDVCVQLLTSANSGWTSIKVGAAAAITAFPIAPTTASSATNCAAAATNTITFTGS